MKSLVHAFVCLVALTPAAFLAAQTVTDSAPEGTGPLPIEERLPLKGVPVGAILPYLGPLDVLPPGWQPCDGRVVRDPDSPLHGVRLPDLSDERFLMGVATSASVGVSGGANELSLDGAHDHRGRATNRVNQQSGAPRYLVDLGERGFKHTHDLSISTNGLHSHGGDNRPQFYGVRFIIRVK